MPESGESNPSITGNQLSTPDNRESAQTLLASVKTHLPMLETLLDQCNSEWGADDAVYRFYHQSFKVYRVQSLTLEIVAALQALTPDRPLNRWFMQIVREGSRKTFSVEDNQRWPEVTRPIIEAFFHARHFLSVAVHSARQLEEVPGLLPINWATLLYLYGLR